ncbi:MAG TPA: DNA polymerase III subunit gamma/tau [Kiritimatiellia bacterium]|nr:DNA polymerase III subunit gamma/tau [Kiritimatiellia bacterium]HRZ11957.1 DNA polymerase III subunit gamma/tau [Kiritimatiellia bacterium]HSA17237.1 DNA polymerase III subunit gamma/tau [Kiritimatiellia bacterium]
MAYEVLARKWRPQQFDDVIGQGHVTQTLKNAIASNRVAHAYLFVGPRGVGKTSTARILAKALNCEKGPTPEPCGKCAACREIAAGNCLDVIEIDAASNTGVDNVRDLRENARYAPARGPFKVYIIDEVHMLSVAAFNALLKTLEEPPAHVKFIFATTEPQKVPATILSRCQRFDLRRISARDIVGRLTEIAKAEKVSVDPDALLAIARGAEGGLRDAESALDQLIAFRGKAIKEDDVLAVFGLVARQTLDELMEAVLKGDVATAVRRVGDLDRSGKDLQRLVFELLEQARNIVICQYTGADPAGLEVTEAQAESIRRQAAMCDAGRVLRVVDILTEVEGRIRYALSRRALLETALIRSGRAAVTVTLDELLAQVNQLKAGLGAGANDPSPAAAPARAEPAAARPPASPPKNPAKDARPASEEVAALAGGWLDIVERVSRLAPLAKSYLLDGKPIHVQGARVIVGFDPEFASNKEKIEYPRNLKAVNKVLGEVLRREVTVEFRVLDAKATVPGDIKVREVAAPPGKTEPAAEEAQRPRGRSAQEWVKNPAVKKTLELFSGDIVDIRE